MRSARIAGASPVWLRGVEVLALSVAFLLAFAPTRARAAPPASRAKLLAPADLDGKTLHELALMQAEPHARAGQVFLEWWVRSHFEKQSWYRPGRYDATRLTDVDRKNLETLESYLAAMPRAALVERWDALLRRHRYAREPEKSGLAFSTDGRTLVSYPAPLIIGRGPMSYWDAKSGERLARMAWPARLVWRGYYATPYGRRLQAQESWPALLNARFVGSELVVASEYHVLIGAPPAQAPKRGLLIGPNWRKDGGRDGGFQAACIAPDGSTLVALDDHRLKTFDLVKGQPGHVHDLPRSSGPITIGPRCEFFDATRALIAVEHGGDSYVFDTKTRSVTRLAVPRGMTRVSRGGELVALWNVPGTTSHDVIVFGLRGAPKELRRLAGTIGTTNAWFTPDGRKVLVSGSGGALTLHDLRDGSRVSWRSDRTFDWPGTPMKAESESGYLFPSLVEDARERLERYGGADLASAVAFSPDGTRAAIAFGGGYLEMRDVHSGARTSDFRGHEPWSDEEIWEASLLARRLGLKLEEDWPKPPRDVNPLDHLAALDRPLPKSALEPLSRLDLRLLRNTIAARRGATFKAKTLTDVFSQLGWYKPNPAYTSALLSAVDRANILAIRRREAVLGGPLTEAEAVKHTEFVIYAGMHDWQLVPNPQDPERTGSW